MQIISVCSYLSSILNISHLKAGHQMVTFHPEALGTFAGTSTAKSQCHFFLSTVISVSAMEIPSFCLLRPKILFSFTFYFSPSHKLHLLNIFRIWPIPHHSHLFHRGADCHLLPELLQYPADCSLSLQYILTREPKGILHPTLPTVHTSALITFSLVCLFSYSSDFDFPQIH